MGRRVLPLMALSGLCLVVALPVGAGDASHIRPRIVNGVLTPAFPTVGALLNPADLDTGSVGCSGTLIGCETFLTAGHCVCPSELAPCIGPNAPDPSTMGVFFQHAGFFSVTSIALRPDFDFPVGDVAVLKLGAPVVGIAPTPVDTLGPVFGTSGTIVGFGRSGGSQSDYGLKRAGDIVTASCAASGVSDTTSVCWNFTAPVGTPGTDSNTCNADSGGPLFIDYGSGPVIAGVTSGGQNPNCLADDASVDAKVAQYAAWIQTEGGADLANTSCGSGPQVGGDGTTIVAATGSLSASLTQRLHSFAVGTGVGRLRVGFNAHDSGTADFNLYVKAGSVPTPSDFDCAADGSGQFGFCEFAAPTPGTWYALVDRVVGSGTYQLTFTSFGPDCALPESAGLPCNDGNVCTDGDVCQSGDCVGSALPNGTACDDADPCTRPDTCQAGACVNDAVPLSGCGTAAQSALLLKQKGGTKDKLLWKWVKGAATDAADLGTPTSSTDYAFCLYAGTAAVLAADVAIPADPLKWSPLSDRGYKYKDPDATINGMQRVLLKGGDAGKSKILLKGAGDGLPDPLLGLALPVKVQLINLDNDACWEADYDLADVIKNETGQFKVKRSN